MSRIKGLSVGGIVLLALLGSVSFTHSKAPTTPVNQAIQNEGGQPMQALLNEVHQLRLAIQRSNLNTYHAQVTLERFRLQQEQVNRLHEKLEGVRARLAEMKLQQPRLAEELKRTEENLGHEADAAKRRGLENFQQQLKSEQERLAQMEAQVREQEAQLTAQQQAEQAKLAELNERLDALQKELEVVDKPPTNGKR
jgi:DNA repair exonuclease SbcCD ATPase subunit